MRRGRPSPPDGKPITAAGDIGAPQTIVSDWPLISNHPAVLSPATATLKVKG